MEGSAVPGAEAGIASIFQESRAPPRKYGHSAIFPLFFRAAGKLTRTDREARESWSREAISNGTEN